MFSFRPGNFSLVLYIMIHAERILAAVQGIHVRPGSGEVRRMKTMSLEWAAELTHVCNISVGLKHFHLMTFSTKTTSGCH